MQIWDCFLCTSMPIKNMAGLHRLAPTARVYSCGSVTATPIPPINAAIAPPTALTPENRTDPNAKKNPSTTLPSQFMLLPSSRLSCEWFSPSGWSRSSQLSLTQIHKADAPIHAPLTQAYSYSVRSGRVDVPSTRCLRKQDTPGSTTHAACCMAGVAAC